MDASKRICLGKMWMIAMAFTCVLSLDGQSQIRDTVSIRGFKFLLAETTEEDNGTEIQVLNLVRIASTGSKWLCKYPIRAEFPDCNSIQLELGRYVTNDSNLVFYTVWMFSQNALAGMEGMRKQTFTVSPTGKLYQVSNVFWANVGPQHHCLADLNLGIEEMFAAATSREQRAEQKLFIQCIEGEISGKFVFGMQREILVREVATALEREIALAKAKYRDLF